MEMRIFGKQGGSFTNSEGEYIEYRKIYGLIPAGYVDQINAKDKVVAGGECGAYSCTAVSFNKLPNSAAEYGEEGIICDVDFNDKKRIVDVSIIS